MPNQTDTGAIVLESVTEDALKRVVAPASAVKAKDESRKELNNFDFLRFAAASLVILHHSYSLLAKPEPLYSITGVFSFGDFAVGVFFVISGFLITASFERCKAITPFVLSRFLRMWPALFAACCFAVFVIGPLNTKWPLSDYFKSPETWSYFKNLTLIDLQWGLPAVFIDNPFKNVTNGSLWTLPIEVTMYGVTLCLGLLGFYRFRFSVLAIFAIVLALQMQLLSCPNPAALTMHWFPGWAGETRFSTLYLGGAVLYLFRDCFKFSWQMALVCLILFAGSFHTAVFNPIMFLTLPYLVLFCAYASIPYLNKWGRFGDFSYGLYVYAFPIQQTIIHFTGGKISVCRHFILSFLLTLLAAVLSYHMLEHPCLKLKGRLKRKAPAQ